MSTPDTTISRILRDGGEAIIVDAALRTHYVSVAEHGLLVEHRRYDGAPGEIVPALSAAMEHGEDLEIVAGVTGIDMI